MTSPPRALKTARSKTPRILLTGGAGYIGSHTAIELIQQGYDVLILDNFCNAHRQVLTHMERLAGCPIPLVEGDVRDAQLLQTLFADHPIDGVLHFAGLKAVGESVAKPALYYDVNVGGALTLIQAMAAAGVGALVFSSSATIYGEPDVVPLKESAPARPESPYGRSKLWVEQIMADTATALPAGAFLALRYFNPVGAHGSGQLGEDPSGTPNNLFPYMAQVASGRRPALTIFGDDYPTPDGTGVRDYIHVVDLARGHVAALAHVLANPRLGFEAINLGTGTGHSVLEVCAAFERASGTAIRRRTGPRRAGDVAAYWADPAKARQVLGWRAERDLARMCADAWRWQQAYPNGYGGS